MIYNLIFGLSGGFATASWGAFKDSPYENFSLLSFLRSPLITVVYYMGLLTIFTGNQSNIHNFVYLFSAIALERLTQEYWKAFFRKNQRKNIYKIPQSFHIFGKVPTYTTRIIIGILITSLTSVIIILLSLLKYYGNYWIIPSIILSIIPAIGGVWKDAPIEGFEILKFPRSFIVMFLSAFIIHSYTDNLAILILGSAARKIFPNHTQQTVVYKPHSICCQLFSLNHLDNCIMAIITRLSAGKRNPSRVNIYVDGLFTLALSLDEVVKQGLAKGVELSPERIQSLKAFDDAEKVYAKVLNFLSFRPRSIKEVRDRLREYQVKDPDQQDSLINRLIDKGYLDDLAFARWFVNSRNSFRPRSALQLSAELAQKGISRDLIKMVITPFGSS